MSTKQNPPRKGADLILPRITSADGKRSYAPFNFGEFARQAHAANTPSARMLAARRAKLAAKIGEDRAEMIMPSPVKPGWKARVSSFVRKLFSRKTAQA